MSLQLAPPEERSPLKFVLIAAAIMTPVILLLYFNIWRKMAEVTVVKTDIFAPHTVMKQMPGTTHILGSLGEQEDNVYVVAHVNFIDKMSTPIFFDTVSAIMTDQSGATLEATPISARDLPNLEQSFPQLTSVAGTPFADGDQFSPNTPREGTILLLFPHINQQTWASRKSATLTLNLAHQQPLTIPIP